jgi:hypothetical protein
MKRWIQWAALSTCLGGVACSGAREAELVARPLLVHNSSRTPVLTDLGYVVTLNQARLVLDDFEFTIAGEAHVATLWQRMSDLLVPPAHAHPGHYQGGEVTGELPGHFILDLISDNPAAVGMAELIVGTYQGSNFTFGQATRADGLAADDPLLGHTAHLVGVATRGGESHVFQIAIDAPEDRQLVGAPFQVTIDASGPLALGFELMTIAPEEGDTLFDGIDFGAMPEAEGGVALSPSSTATAVVDAYNNLRRALLTHDHFAVKASGAR